MVKVKYGGADMDEIFEERFVVFLDILGFSSMVSAAAKDPYGESARQVETALTIIENMKLIEGDRVDQNSSIVGYRSHIFSDCIVMSVPESKEAVSKLFIELAKLTVNLMAIGVWIRGGMSSGKISRKATTPWGPAIVEAYRIESELAENPRIALSKSAIKFVTEKLDDKEKNGLIIRDNDGVWALAPFVWSLRDSYGGGIYLTQEIGDKIKTHLEEAYSQTVDNPRVFRKIDWLSHAWDDQVKPKYGFPSFDCRTEHGKKRDFADTFQNQLDESYVISGGGRF
jgi:hypothetical protein